MSKNQLDPLKRVAINTQTSLAHKHTHTHTHTHTHACIQPFGSSEPRPRSAESDSAGSYSSTSEPPGVGPDATLRPRRLFGDHVTRDVIADCDENAFSDDDKKSFRTAV